MSTPADTTKATDTTTAAADTTATDTASADATQAADTTAPTSTATDTATKAADTTADTTTTDDGKATEPHVPESYTLTLPEQSPLDAESVERIKQDAKALGLTTAQAQKYLESQSQLVKDAIQQAQREFDDLKSDPVLGGANFDATVKHAHAGMKWMFGEDYEQVQEFFTRFGFDNNKLLVKGLARLGKATAEDSAIRAATAPKPERKDTKDVLFASSAAKA